MLLSTIVISSYCAIPYVTQFITGGTTTAPPLYNLSFNQTMGGWVMFSFQHIPVYSIGVSSRHRRRSNTNDATWKQVRLGRGDDNGGMGWGHTFDRYTFGALQTRLFSKILYV